MSDLVKKLRDPLEYPTVNNEGKVSVFEACKEAADEIERLTAEVGQRDKLVKLLLKECEEMDFDHSNACMNWSMLEHSQIECALCQLRRVNE
jgi:hypothetical protein